MPKMDPEMQAFQAELLGAVRDMKAHKAARVTRIEVPAAADARARLGLSQSHFAALLGVSVRTLQNWEQGRTQPSGAAQTLIRVAIAAPQVLKAVVA